MSSHEKLMNHIVSLSESDSYTSAKDEWELFDVHFSDDPEGETCPCGKTHIRELCYIRNKYNGTEIFVGNTCVKQFMNIDTGTFFSGIKRLKKDPINANPSRSVIDYAWKFGFLYGKNEYDFLVNIHRKRELSEKQIDWRRKIVRRILERIVVAPKQR